MLYTYREIKRFNELPNNIKLINNNQKCKVLKDARLIFTN